MLVVKESNSNVIKLDDVAREHIIIKVFNGIDIGKLTYIGSDCYGFMDLRNSNKWCSPRGEFKQVIEKALLTSDSLYAFETLTEFAEWLLHDYIGATK